MLSSPTTEMKRLPTPEESRNKTQRHRDLISKVSKAVVASSDFKAVVVQDIAELVANYLQAECVCIFFRRKGSTLKALERWALAINSDCEKMLKPEADFGFDKKYTYENDSSTLMLPPTTSHEPHAEARKKGDPLNLGRAEIDQLSGNLEYLIEDFKDNLPSQQLSHLILVPIRLFGQLLGVIRCVNHLDSTHLPCLSEQNFSENEDVSIVVSIGAMLAIAYANYRKSEKITALNELGNKIAQAPSGEDAIQACLEDLASDKTGFRLAMWRVYEKNGTSKVLYHHSPEDERIELNPVDLQLAPGQGIPLEDTPQVLEIDKRFHYYLWAEENHLKWRYSYKIPLADGRYAGLLVFAEEEADFDSLSKSWITMKANYLRSCLNQIQLKHAVDDILANRIVGSSSKIREAVEKATTVASSTARVLLLGESGTGKELFAKLIWSESERKNEPFITIDCACIPEELMEAELFGYEKGAFTGAITRKQGKVELANKGTLFLDEIGELPLKLQRKLLRFTQQGTFNRVGGTEEIKVDVRLVAATNKRLKTAIETNEFREDLYYRLKVVEIELPPLRDRIEDIPELIEYFLKKHRHPDQQSTYVLDENARKALENYNWPGNVRELTNTVESAVALRPFDNLITVNHLATEIVMGQTAKAKPSSSSACTKLHHLSPNPILWSDVDALTRAFLIDTMKKHRGHKPSVAMVLGLARSTLDSKLKHYKIKMSDFNNEE